MKSLQVPTSLPSRIGNWWDERAALQVKEVRVTVIEPWACGQQRSLMLAPQLVNYML